MSFYFDERWFFGTIFSVLRTDGYIKGDNKRKNKFDVT